MESQIEMINEFLSKCVPSMEEFRVSEDKKPVIDKGWILQLKYDGWFAIGIIRKGTSKCKVYSRGSELIATFDVDMYTQSTVVFVGEYMYGTNWAQSHFPNKFFVHDILLSPKMDYADRMMYLKESLKDFDEDEKHLVSVTSYKACEFDKIWDKYVEKLGYEGIVAQNPESFGYPGNVECKKLKKTYTMDYIITGINEGGGRLQGKCGAILGGLYKNGKIETVVSVGGGMSDALRADIWKNKKSLIGKVFEAYGWQIFESGSLRHPNFKRFRDDKKASECVWK